MEVEAGVKAEVTAGVKTGVSVGVKAGVKAGVRVGVRWVKLSSIAATSPSVSSPSRSMSINFVECGDRQAE